MAILCRAAKNSLRGTDRQFGYTFGVLFVPFVDQFQSDRQIGYTFGVFLVPLVDHFQSDRETSSTSLDRLLDGFIVTADYSSSDRQAVDSLGRKTVSAQISRRLWTAQTGKTVTYQTGGLSLYACERWIFLWYCNKTQHHTTFMSLNVTSQNVRVSKRKSFKT